MNSNKGKIAAFTMVDVLTGMIITSIIMSMVFYLFTALNKQVADYGQVRTDLNGYLLLRSDLERQFDSNDKTITGVPGGILLRSKEQELTYLKEGDYLLRLTPTSEDTLSKNITDFKVSFFKDKFGKSTDLVKEIELKISMNEQELTCELHKEAGLAEFINQQLLHEF